MNPRTQLDAIIAEHLDPTTTEQFEAAEAMVQAAYNLSLERIAKLETQIEELKDTNSHLLKDHRKWYAEELDEHKAEIVEPLHERIAELEAIMRHTHICSRKHTAGYCTVRQSDIDAMGAMIFPLDDCKEAS